MKPCPALALTVTRPPGRRAAGYKIALAWPPQGSPMPCWVWLDASPEATTVLVPQPEILEMLAVNPPV